MSQKAILDALATRLASSTLYTTLGGRLGLDELAANTALPLMVYRVTGTQTAQLFGGTERYDLTLEFQFYQKSSDGTQMHTLSSQLKTALDASLAASGFDRIVLIRTSTGTPSYEDDSWTMTDTYRAVGFRL